MIKGIVLPGESEPSSQFAIEQRGREEIECGRVGDEIDYSEQKDEDRELEWVVEFHLASGEGPEGECLRGFVVPVIYLCDVILR